MKFILNLIFKGLVEWLYEMISNIVEYFANALLKVFGMDLTYFEQSIPITTDIVNIMICVGWALLLGNLVFQAMKTMATGLGFEGEDPRTLFGRTFVMSFLLVTSRQVCDIGLGITQTVIGLLQVPSAINLPKISESMFNVPGDASWLLCLIVGVVVMIQVVKLFFEIGERYVVVAVLTILSPLAFSMGGSKNTSDIFKGWVRMYGSMCLMMVMNVVFLKLLVSAMGLMPSGPEVIAWLIFVVAIARVGRKIDNVISRIGLNPAITGDPLGHSRMPGMVSMMVFRGMTNSIGKAAQTNKTEKRAPVKNGGGSAMLSSSSRTGGSLLSASKGVTPSPALGGHSSSDSASVSKDRGSNTSTTTLPKNSSSGHTATNTLGKTQTAVHSAQPKSGAVKDTMGATASKDTSRSMTSANTAKATTPSASTAKHTMGSRTTISKGTPNSSYKDSSREKLKMPSGSVNDTSKPTRPPIGAKAISKPDGKVETHTSKTAHSMDTAASAGNRSATDKNAYISRNHHSNATNGSQNQRQTPLTQATTTAKSDNRPPVKYSPPPSSDRNVSHALTSNINGGSKPAAPIQSVSGDKAMQRNPINERNLNTTARHTPIVQTGDRFSAQKNDKPFTRTNAGNTGTAVINGRSSSTMSNTSLNHTNQRTDNRTNTAKNNKQNQDTPKATSIQPTSKGNPLSADINKNKNKKGPVRGNKK